MKNFTLIPVLLFALVCCQNNAQQKTDSTGAKSDKNMARENIYQFKVRDLSGKKFDMATLQGKKVLIVNTASKCGLTPQYKELEAIYQQYRDSDFVVLGFPANNFAGQEPGTNEEIGAFCEKNYGVTFPMMSKISVKGDDMHELYQFLTQKSRNGVADSEVQWNFQKYLIDEKGELVKVVDPKTPPTDPVIINWIKS